MKKKAGFWRARGGWAAWVTALVLASLLAACGPKVPPASTPSANTPATTTAASEAQASEAAYPVTVQDDLGQELTFDQAPQRIVPFVPSATDIVLALGLKDRIVAVDKWSAGQYKDVQGLPAMDSYNVDYEKLEALKPDLILTLPGQYLDKMRQLGLKVFVLQPADVQGVYRDFETLGRVTGTKAQAEKVIEELKAGIEPVEKAVAAIPAEKRVKVYYESWNDPIYSAGPGSFVDGLIREAGGVNVLADAKQPWPSPSAEEVIQRAPDVIIGPASNTSLKDLQAGKRPGWGSVPAVKNGRVYILDDALLSQPDTHIDDAIHALAHDFYPDVVK
ncbi:MAG: ABC transporter substrate-binding protein [Firmicutes bacterium]|nr:ABC transporter substrate-binding protein [Bacillota bacterium]